MIDYKLIKHLKDVSNNFRSNEDITLEFLSVYCEREKRYYDDLLMWEKYESQNYLISPYSKKRVKEGSALYIKLKNEHFRFKSRSKPINMFNKAIANRLDFLRRLYTLIKPLKIVMSKKYKHEVSMIERVKAFNNNKYCIECKKPYKELEKITYNYVVKRECKCDYAFNYCKCDIQPRYEYSIVICPLSHILSKKGDEKIVDFKDTIITKNIL